MTWNKEDCRLVLLYVGHSKGVTPFKTHFHAFFKTPSSNIFLRTGLFVCSHENGKTTGCQLCEGWMWIPSFCFLFWFQLKEVKAFLIRYIKLFFIALHFLYARETTLDPWFERLQYILDLRDCYISWIWVNTMDIGFKRLQWISDLRDYYGSLIWETTLYTGFERLLYILDLRDYYGS